LLCCATRACRSDHDGIGWKCDLPATGRHRPQCDFRDGTGRPRAATGSHDRADPLGAAQDASVASRDGDTRMRPADVRTEQDR
jgi:hypothetical protein